MSAPAVMDRQACERLCRLLQREASLGFLRRNRWYERQLHAIQSAPSDEAYIYEVGILSGRMIDHIGLDRLCALVNASRQEES